MADPSTAATEVGERTAPGQLDRSMKPIGEYGLLADCNSAALVDRGGSIEWLCMPRYDSDAIFASILDPDAGHWSVRPAGSYEVERRYLDGTLIIETTFTTEDGAVRLTDAMAFPEGQRGHELGLDVPHELLRLVEGVSGSVEVEMELAPRPEYGSPTAPRARSSPLRRRRCPRTPEASATGTTASPGSGTRA